MSCFCTASLTALARSSTDHGVSQKLASRQPRQGIVPGICFKRLTMHAVRVVSMVKAVAGALSRTCTHSPPTTRMPLRLEERFASFSRRARRRHTTWPAQRVTPSQRSDGARGMDTHACAPGKSWPLVIVPEYRFKAGLPSCVVPSGKHAKSKKRGASVGGCSSSLGVSISPILGEDSTDRYFSVQVAARC